MDIKRGAFEWATARDLFSNAEHDSAVQATTPSKRSSETLPSENGHHTRSKKGAVVDNQVDNQDGAQPQEGDITPSITLKLNRRAPRAKSEGQSAKRSRRSTFGKQRRRKHATVIQESSSREPPKNPWESVLVNFISGLPVSDGHDTVFTAIDLSTKQAHLMACKKTCSVGDISHLYLRHVFKLHGFPKSMFIDVQNELLQSVCNNFVPSTGTQLHDKLDSQQMVDSLVRRHAVSHERGWSNDLHLIEFAYNKFTSSATGASPFRKIYGFDVASLPSSSSNSIKTDDGALLQEMKKLMEIENYIIELTDPSVAFRPGDSVLLKILPADYNHAFSRSDKLFPSYCGPFKIITSVAKGTYMLDVPKAWGFSETFDSSQLQHSLETAVDYIPVKDGQVMLIAESILDTRFSRIQGVTKMEYLVKWKGYAAAESTWESEVPLQEIPLSSHHCTLSLTSIDSHKTLPSSLKVTLKTR